MKMNDLTKEQLDAFCRELGELLMKHKVTIDICSCGEVLELREWDGTIICGVSSGEFHDRYLWIDES